MASASSKDQAEKPTRTRIRKRGPVDPKPSKTPAARVAPKRQLPFLPGSLNDQLSKLEVNESLARVLRLDLGTFGGSDDLNIEAQKFYKAQNSILSGSIAKVRAGTDHKHKRYKMERGSYMTSGNDAMFVLITVTRTE